MPKYIGAWTIHTSSLRRELQTALQRDEITATDIVWAGPSGDVVVAATASDIEDIEEYAEYIDSGMVSEYLD